MLELLAYDCCNGAAQDNQNKKKGAEAPFYQANAAYLNE
jgi:hypothetical protein